MTAPARRARAVVVAAASIQAYLFATQKRREMVGASHLVAQLSSTAGDGWWTAAVDEVRRGQHVGGSLDDPGDALVLVAASAGSVVAVAVSDATDADERTGAACRAVVSSLTRRALVEAPGLVVAGAVSDAFDWGSGALATQIATARGVLATQVREWSAAETRFPCQPLTRVCEVSGLPVADTVPAAGAVVPRSRPSIARLQAADNARQRLQDLADRDYDDVRVTRRLEDDADWVAVIHADGDGFGSLFTRIPQWQDAWSAGSGEADPDRRYVAALQGVSSRLEDYARDAFRAALDAADAADRGGQAAVLPLVVGGDDLTVVCDGRVALPFTAAYLAGFEQRCAQDQDLAKVLAASGLPPLTATAGVAVTKRHFPFIEAFGLAEHLMNDAKDQRRQSLAPSGSPMRPASAIAFHVVHDSVSGGWDDLGRRLASADGTVRLTAQPLLITEGDVTGAWTGRRWIDHEQRVAYLRDRQLSSSAAHQLRAALLVGRDAADRSAARITAAGADLGERSLYVAGGGGSHTWLLDAMTHLEIEGTLS